VGVAPLLGPELGRGVHVMMQEVAGQIPRLSLQPDDLMDLLFLRVVGPLPPHQAQLVVRIPAGVAHGPAEEVVVAGNPVADDGLGIVRVRFDGGDRAHLLPQFLRGPFVGVQEKDPVILT